MRLSDLARHWYDICSNQDGEKVNIYMKRELNRLLILALTICFAAIFHGCGHGRDAEPYPIGSTDSPDWGNLSEEQETIPLGVVARNSVDDASLDSIQTFVDVLNSIDFVMPYVKLSKVSNPYSYVPTRYDDISLTKEGEVGGTAHISGNTVTASQFGIHCAVIADLSVEYASYSNPENTFISGTEEDTFISGTGEVRIVASSYGCDFFKNMHIDFKMNGNLAVNGGTIRDLEFSADFTLDDGVTILVHSAIFETTEEIRHCYYNEASDRTVCPPVDPNTLEDKGETDPECDPSIDPRYTATYLLRGKIYSYETTLRCSDEGLWTPPCPFDGSFNPCSSNSICAQPEDEGWGYNLEDYGYCSLS